MSNVYTCYNFDVLKLWKRIKLKKLRQCYVEIVSPFWNIYKNVDKKYKENILFGTIYQIN